MHQAPPTPPAQEAMAAPQGQFLHSSPSAVHPMLEREREREGVGGGGREGGRKRSSEQRERERESAREREITIR